MPMAPKTDAEKVAKLREMAKDKSLPQPVRNQYLDQAVKMEEKAAMKAGVKMAKGGMAKKKYAVGGMASQIPLMEPKRGPATPAPTATPSMKDRVSKLSSMVKASAPRTAPTAFKPQVNVQPKPFGKPQVNVQPKPIGKPQVNVQPTPPVLGKPQVNVQPRMAKGGSVAKKAKGK